MDINFFISDNFVASKTSDIIIISNSKESLTSRFNELAVAAGISNKDDITFLDAVAKARLIPAAETTCAVELFVRGETAANPPRRIILALLPLQYSRHNTPSRSHSVASTIKAHKGSSKDLTVILAPSDNHYLFPQALSVSRQFSSYFLKKPSNAEIEEMKVNVVLHVDEGTASSAHIDAGFLLQKLTNLSKGIRLAQRLVDSPPNVLHTDAYVQECIIVANRLGCAIKVLS
jgi:probable aminopeptidase NPEPL1